MSTSNFAVPSTLFIYLASRAFSIPPISDNFFHWTLQGGAVCLPKLSFYKPILGKGEIYIWMEGKQIIILFVVSSHLGLHSMSHRVTYCQTTPPSPKKCDEVYGRPLIKQFRKREKSTHLYIFKSTYTSMADSNVERGTFMHRVIFFEPNVVLYVLSVQQRRNESVTRKITNFVYLVRILDILKSTTPGHSISLQDSIIVLRKISGCHHSYRGRHHYWSAAEYIN